MEVKVQVCDATMLKENSRSSAPKENEEFENGVPNKGRKL